MFKPPKILGLPYRNFKHKISITKMLERYYHIEDLGGVIYATRKN